MARVRGKKKSHWCFTSYEEKLPIEFDESKVRYVIYQQETCPETKRTHWQGYIEFFDTVRHGQVKAVVGECHLEFRRGSRTDAREYCRKQESAIPGTQFEYGEWRQDVNRKRKLSDILKTDMSLADVIEETPHFYVMYHRGLKALYSYRQKKQAKTWRDVSVVAYVGATGTGKTRKATEGTDWYILPQSNRLWLDGYEGESTLIIDDFYGGMKYSTLLRVLDGHALQLEVKGGFVYAMWTKVIITSNDHPRLWYKKGFTPALQRRITTITNFP